MTPQMLLVLTAAGFVILFLLFNIRSVVIYEYQRGLLFKQGKFKKELEPGVHRYFNFRQKVQTIDVRTRSVTIPGQEVLSSDNVGVRISLAVSYHIDNPYQAIVKVEDYFQAMYLDIQVNLRDIVGSVSIDEFLTKRKDLGNQLLELSQEKASNYGICLETVSLKDVMFPGDLKNIFAQVVNAKLEGLASLERARGESAALRNLANTAKLFENNPGLLQLRLIQTIDKNSGNTIILGDISDKVMQSHLLPGEKISKQG